jgi:RNA recognition motif-containing protein
MGNIEPWMNESFIMNSFIEYGFRPKNIKLVRDKRFNKLSNYCFVNFNSYQEANNALFKLNTKIIQKTNKYFKLNIAKYNYKFSKSLYVGNLSPKINDSDLFNIFKSKYPSVYYASIITDNGISRGYGFVHFGNEDEYKKSLKEMNGIFIDNRIIRVKEKNCEEKKDKYQFNNNINFNCIKNNYLMEKIEEEKYSLDNEETNCSLVEREQELSLSDTSNSNNKSFINNLKLLESDDIITLNNKIQEKIDNLYNYEKTIKNNNNISKILLYYRSN